MKERILAARLSRVLGGMVTLAVLLFLVTALFGLFNPRDTSQPEGAVVAAVLRLAQGESLYLDIHNGHYVTAMYGPFHYFVLGGVVRLLGVGVSGAYLAGRILSLVSALTAAALVGYLGGRLGASRPARWIAAGLFLASPLILPVAYSSRCDLPATAVALAGLALFDRFSGSPWVYAAAAPLLAAIYTKQTALAAFLAVVLFLLLQRRPGRALAMAAAVILPAAAILFFLIRETGGLAAVNLLQVPGASPLSLFERPAGNLVNFLSLAALPLILAAPVLPRLIGKDEKLRLMSCYAITALMVSLAASAKLGSDNYYFIEPLAVTLVFSALGLTALLSEGRTLAERPALLTAGAFLVLLTGAMGLTARIGKYFYESNGEVIRVAAAAPGDVLIEDENVSLKCGKPLTMMDPFAFAYLERQGVWDADPLARRILNHQFAAIILRAPIERPSRYQGQVFWPEKVLAAIGRAYVSEERIEGFVIYRPRPEWVAAREGGRS